MKMFFKTVLLTAMFSNLIACSYQPEDEGQCKLVCGNAIIAGNDLPITIAAKTPTVATECATASAGSPVGPYRAGFLIGEAIKDQTGADAGVRPIPNISIEPLLVGLRPTTNNENDADSRYRGLLTLKDNWCSDSCGVVMLDTMSICPGASASSELLVQIHSGALFSEALKFLITTKAPE